MRVSVSVRVVLAAKRDAQEGRGERREATLVRVTPRLRARRRKTVERERERQRQEDREGEGTRQGGKGEGSSAFLILVISNRAQMQPHIIFILAGQSNIAGRGDLSHAPEVPP